MALNRVVPAALQGLDIYRSWVGEMTVVRVRYRLLAEAVDWLGQGGHFSGLRQSSP